MKKYNRLIFFLIILLAAFTQCRKEAVLPVPEVPVNPPVTAVIPEASEVNNFVWSYMEYYYLWYDKIPALTNSNYQPLTTTSTNYKRNKDSLNVFLNKYTDPGKLFIDLLYQYKTVDKYSFITDDYTTLENMLAGISESSGADYQLYYLNSTSKDVIGVVRYVLKGSPADLAGVVRGDIFNKIDGVQLTDANYNSLLYRRTTATYTASGTKIVNGVMTPTGKNVTITPVVLQENPVFLSKVLTVNGSKIGYLVYNGFTSDFDLELYKAFQQFKNEGISKLIMDLRYNGGGSVQTAIYLASMIYSTNTTKVFAKSIWNNKLSSNNGDDFFSDKITKSSTNTTPINSLNLSDVYFIVSGETASASELLINGLEPYINPKIIGTNTYGKYVASITIYDYAVDASGKLIPDGKGGYAKVASHKYAMQPIIAKYANSAGVSDFYTGLAPDITLKEDIGNMLPLGDENELLLKAVLDNIRGLKAQRITNPSSLANAKSLVGSKEQNRFSRDMFIDPLKLVKPTN